jgi:outer membrane protein OmpA-like peptidoglycan-associated protein
VLFTAVARAEGPGVLEDPGRVRFSKDVSTVDGDDPWAIGARMVLDRLANALFRTGSPRRIRFEGHAWRESRAAELAQSRADSVRAYLIAKGIDPKRLQAVGYSDTRPLGTSDENRRVDFVILDR